MTYVNTNDSYGSFVKYSGSASTYTYSYNTLSLNSSVSDQDQLIVIRKFTPSSTFEAAAAPDGLGGTKIAASEQWEAWTLPNTSTSGSSMYTIDSVNKTITMSSTASDYAWDRDGTTVNLPAFDPSTDTIIIARKTYGVAPFVTWSSGSKLTSSQLNHQTTQLIYLTQELLDKVYYASDLDPYYGTPSGYATLDTSGIMAQGETNTITAGDGLSGGGTVGSNPTLAVDLATDSGLEFDSNQLQVKTNTTVQRGASGLDVVTKTNGGLLSDSDGVYVDLEDSVTSESATKALTANQGKILKALIDAQGTGIAYLGSVVPGVQATAVNAIDTTGYTASNADASFTIAIPTSAGGLGGTAVTILLDEDKDDITQATAAANTITIGTKDASETDALTASFIINALNGVAAGRFIYASSGNGESGDDLGITAKQGSSDTQITLTMDKASTTGNISSALTSASGVNIIDVTAFTGGIDQSSFPTTPGGRAFAAGDTVDTITRSGFVTPTGSSTQIEVALGEDLRYNASSEWYNAGATATLDDTSYFKTDGSRTATGQFNLGSNKITALATPTGNTDAATKAYVDSGWFTGTPAANHILKYSGSAWVSGTIGMEHLGNENISATPAIGDVIAWDNVNSKWTNSSIISTPQIWYTGGAGDNAITGNADGSNLTFVVGVTPNSTINTAWLITVDGIIQPANKYSISGTTVTFSAGNAPPDEAELYFVCFGASIQTTIASSVGNLSATTVTTTGNITVGGSITAASTLNVSSDLSVNTDKFTVQAATGNTTIAGTLDILGDLSLAGTAFGYGIREFIKPTEEVQIGSGDPTPLNREDSWQTDGSWRSTGLDLSFPAYKAGDILIYSFSWYMYGSDNYWYGNLYKNVDDSDKQSETKIVLYDSAILVDNGVFKSGYNSGLRGYQKNGATNVTVFDYYTITADDVTRYNGGSGSNISITAGVLKGHDSKAGYYYGIYGTHALGIYLTK